MFSIFSLMVPDNTLSECGQMSNFLKLLTMMNFIELIIELAVGLVRGL
jgi:hypothetical protein